MDAHPVWGHGCSCPWSWSRARKLTSGGLRTCPPNIPTTIWVSAKHLTYSHYSLKNIIFEGHRPSRQGQRVILMKRGGSGCHCWVTVMDSIMGRSTHTAQTTWKGRKSIYLIYSHTHSSTHLKRQMPLLCWASINNIHNPWWLSEARQGIKRGT